jgi:choline monooxygenase
MPQRNVPGLPGFPRLRKEDLAIKPIERAETIPSRWYTGPEFHDADMNLIFARSWQYAGSVSQVMNPGDYLLASAANNPVIIIRGKDGVLRGFYNVCRHRGGPLAIDPQGNCSILQCKYHGWTYLLDGSLRGTPKFDRTELFDRKDYGLVPVTLEVWENLIFVSVDPGAPPLGSVMSGIRERIGPAGLGLKQFYKRVTYDVNANWKVYIDNYLEGYHLPFVHPELCKLLDYQNYVTETFAGYSLQYSPFMGTKGLYTAGDGEALYYCIFPNFMLNILPGRLQTNLVLPVSHDRCVVHFDYYYDDLSSPGAQRVIQGDLEYSDLVQREDIEICELVQRGLASAAYDRGRFSPDMEQGVYHFQNLLKQKYRKNLAGPPGRQRGKKK